MAADVAKLVIAAASGSGPPNPVTTASGNDWTKVEFEIIISGSGTSYGSVGDGIYSNDNFNNASAPFDSNSVAIWHNHASSGRSANQQLIDRYPSVNPDEANDDWRTLQTFADRVAPNDPSFDPSLFITDAAGVTREFKLSDRAALEGLNQAQMQAGTGLAGRDRTNTAC